MKVFKLRNTKHQQGADAVKVQKASQTLAIFAGTGCEQVGKILCVPLNFVALEAKLANCAASSSVSIWSEESLFKQQAFSELVCNASCLPTAANCCIAAKPEYCNLQLSYFVTNLGPPKASLPTFAVHSLEVWAVPSLTCHCDSSTIFSTVKLTLWSAATVMNSHKDCYTACVPTSTQRVKQRS